MPIDANIAMGVKPIELESPLNSLSKMLQVQDMQQSGQLNRMKMDEYGRGVQRSNALQSLLQADYANPEARQSAMLKGGFLKEAQEYGKGNSDLAKTNMEVSKGEADILDKTLSSFRSYVPQINSPEAAGQYTAAMYDHPVLGKYAAQFGTRDDVIRRNVEKFQQDPRAWAVGSAGISADKLLESLKGTRQNTNMGGTSQGQTTNYYGEVVPGSTTNTPITQSADNKESVGASYANADATREVAGATRDAAKITRDGETERKMADDYRAQSKGFGEASSAYKQINATLDSATKSPAATLAAATKFMKILDPGSVVRESELGMALQASGVLDRAANYCPR